MAQRPGKRYTLAVPRKRITESLDTQAEEIFELTQLASVLRTRTRMGKTEALSEAEFLTLDFLAKDDDRTVGEIQRHVGVLPAQMSRMIRALEAKEGQALVACQINPQDRRKINVRLTATGRSIHKAYKGKRLALTGEILQALSDSDRARFMRILRQIREMMTARLEPKEH